MHGDAAVGGDHRVGVEPREHRVGDGARLERRAPRRHPFGRVAELECAPTHPEARGEPVEGGERVRSRGHQDVGGFHGDDRGVAATHRGDPRLGREQGEEPGRDGFGTAHGQTVPGDTILAGAVGTMTGP